MSRQKSVYRPSMCTIHNHYGNQINLPQITPIRYIVLDYFKEFNSPYHFYTTKKVFLPAWSLFCHKNQRTSPKVFILLSFLSYIVSTYVFVYNHSVFIYLYAYYIISLRMLLHIVNNCIREKTS